MDLSSLFANAFQPVKILEISSDLVVPLSFPGGCSVPAIEGRVLSNDSSWNCVRVDLFVSAEEALASFETISTTVSDFINVPGIITHSNGKYRRILIYDALHRKQAPSPENVHTFVPISILMGLLLINLHNFGIPQRLRFNSLIVQSMEVALSVHPKSGLDKSPGNECVAASHRSSESDALADLFEKEQNEKYKLNYRTMRYLIPPNIARTDMQKLLSDGVPKKIANRVWSKKALWLLCMHPADIPKVHIADLRAKYDCHGLDIVELGALWHILPQWVGGSPKAEWRRALKSRLDELVAREMAEKITPIELRDPAYKGYDGLMIYDPDRQLHRQFGVSATAVGLQPGERRLSVFTSVDVKLSIAAPQIQSPQPVVSAYHSPDTDGEKEGIRNSDMWGRGRASSSEMLDSHSDSDSNISIKWSSTRSKKRDRGTERSPRKEEEITARSRRERRATVLPLSPLSGLLFKDNSTSDIERERAGSTDKDKDTELDDLLNYEINLSCLDLDDEMVDCLSAKSRGSSNDNNGEDFAEGDWRDVSEQLSPSSHQEQLLTMGYDGGLSTYFPASHKRNDVPASANRNGDSLEASIRIKNIRPFHTPCTTKKPMKRINFIRASAHTPANKQWLSNVDSSGQTIFENTPGFEHDTNRSTEKNCGLSPRQHVGSAVSSNKRGQARIMPCEILKPWGSTGAKRRNSVSTTATCIHYDTSSSSEKAYDENTDVEVLHSNSMTHSAAPDSLEEIEKDSVSRTASRDPSSVTAIALPLKQAGFLAAISTKNLEVVRSGTKEIIPGPAGGPHFPPETACLSDKCKSLRCDHISSVSDVAVDKKSDPTQKSSCAVSTAVLVYNVIQRSDSSMLGNSVESHLIISGSSHHSLQSSSTDLYSPTIAAAETAKTSKKLGRKNRIGAQLDQLTAKERQKTLVRELESCIEGTFTGSSPSFTIDSVPTPTNIPAPSPSVTAAYIDGPLQFLPAIPLKITKGDDQLHKRFINTFTAVSPKIDRVMSEEEELVDSKIEAEINNFIVPDELSPITLRQYGIEMDVKEVNGIRQNALLSLPALLDEIGRGSKESSGQGGLDVDEDDESLPDLFYTDVGLWGIHLNPYLVDESPIVTETDVALVEEDESQPSDCIERLISEGDATSIALLAGGLRKVCDRNPSTGSDVANSDVFCWIEASEIRIAASTGDTDSEGSTHRNKNKSSVGFSPSVVFSDAPSERAAPVVILTPQEAEDLILFKEARLAWAALEMGALSVSKDFASILLLKLADNSEAVVEPLETLVLLVDKLGADVNVRDGNLMTPMHSLFSCPALGRFVLSRGGDILLKDDKGDCVLALCAEYGYNWLLPAFISMHSRELKLLEDRDRAHEYAVVMLTLWGFGTRVSELIEDGFVCFSADEALELMDVCTTNFENMKEPVETFELLEALILGL